MTFSLETTMASLSTWLDSMGLARYLSLFEQNCIDLRSLPLLTESELAELGIPIGHRKLLLKAIAERNNAPPVAIADQPATTSANRSAERRQLTVMFCDLVGSTAMSQSLDPEALRELMQAYQRTCAGVVEKYAGHVAQYLGDGLMVYFGWPAAHEDDAERAVRAGLEIVTAVKRIALPNSVSPAPTGELAPQSLSVRIGIATGPVVVGETGHGDAAIPKTAIGETPNLAARMQALAQADQILLAPSTQHLLGSVFALADLGEHALKGIAEPVRVWRVTGIHERAGRFDVAPAARGGHDDRLTPYVGREEEISLLLARWRQAVDGEGQLVLLSGEPGIGKSRITQLLHERIAAQSSPSGHIRLRYQCSPFFSASAFYPITQQLTFAAGIDREDSVETKLDKLEASLAVDVADLPTVAPLMAALLSLPAEAIAARYPPRMLSPQKQKELTMLAIADQLSYLSKRQPVLFLFEDAHWIDPSTLELMTLLVGRLRNCAALIVITARPEFVSPWAGESHVTTFSLNRLSRRQAMEIVGKVTQGKALPTEVLDIILARTDGVPLFIEELTTTVLEANFLTDAGTHYTLDAPIPPLAIPSTLQDSLMARLDRLGSAKEMAQIASCIGREFRYEWLLQLTKQDDTDLQNALAKLVDSGLVHVRGTPPDAEYSFKHALVQQSAYDSLLNRRRQDIHHQIAQALQTSFADVVASHPELLARHFTDAGEIDAALPQWIAGAKLAVEQNRHAEALQHVESGLALLERADSSQRVNYEAALLVTATASHFATAGYGSAPAAKLLERIEALLDQVTDPSALDGALYGIGLRAWVGSVDVVKARRMFQRLVDLAEASGSLDRRVFASAALGGLLVHLGQFDQAEPLLDFVIAHYDVARHRQQVSLSGHDSKVIAYGFLCQHWSFAGRLEQARHNGRLAVAHATAIAHPFSLTLARALVSCTLVHLDNSDEVLAMARQCIAIGEEQRLPYWIGWAVVAQANAKVWAGDTQGTVTLYDLALQKLVLTGSCSSAGGIEGPRAVALAQVGQFDVARQAAKQAYEHTARVGERLFLPMTQYACGIVELLDPEGNDALAEKWFLDTIAEGQAQDCHLFELRAAIALAGLWRTQGKAAAAHDMLAPIYAWFTEGLDTALLKQAAALLTELAVSQ